ncbi:MAG TPA: Gfo/Idh/MocA family oxidoreductase [Verrucomicrobiae bacterium]|nr:Gfo/Idh/MocA family oxidoreductase [Verrucomicrobiae bacterium]
MIAPTIRWGILGTAGIARKNWRALRDSGNSIVTAVGSRDVERSRAFIRECQDAMPFETSPRPCSTYEEVIESSDVEAIYIPLPTGIRKQWVLRAAAAGKHVLCEKPCALNSQDLAEMIAACRKHNVQFMDGVMFMHNPRMQRIREWLDDGATTGDVKRIMSVFAFCAVDDFFRDNIRIHSELEPTGCLGDLGWYCIRFSLWAMNWQLPREVSGRILSERGSSISPGSAPTDFSGELIFNETASAGFYCSFLVEKQQWANISGTRGSLRVADFVHAANASEPVVDVNETLVPVRDVDAIPAMAQDARMFRNFSAAVASGRLNDEWPMWALKTQQVADACFRSSRDGGAAISVG